MIDTAVDAAERDLARSICTRMAQRLQGLFSVGLGLARSDGPAARDFLKQRFPDIEAHARVLTTIQGEQSRQRSTAVLEAARQLSGNLASEGAFLPRLRQLRQSFSILCEALEGYARLLEIDASPVERARSVCLSVFDHLEHPSS